MLFTNSFLVYYLIWGISSYVDITHILFYDEAMETGGDGSGVTGEWFTQSHRTSESWNQNTTPVLLTSDHMSCSPRGHTGLLGCQWLNIRTFFDMLLRMIHMKKEKPYLNLGGVSELIRLRNLRHSMWNVYFPDLWRCQLAEGSNSYIYPVTSLDLRISESPNNIFILDSQEWLSIPKLGIGQNPHL